MQYNTLIIWFLMVGVVAFAVQNANAQTEIQQSVSQINQAAEQPAPTSEETKSQKGLKKFDAESFPSVLFTYWEQVAIEDARRSRGLNRAPTDAELTRDLNRGQDELNISDPGIRNISLSGIAYEGSKNWTIWLNGQRVTPKAIPKEALDLKVFKEYIEIKWFDEYTNRIIPIRLRPHQRFNIDTRIFLPG